MKGFVHDLWWITLLRSIALLLFGVASVVWPGITFVSLAVFFAFYVLISGIIDLLMAIGAITHKRVWFLTFILGVAEIAVGVYLLKSPALALATFIATVGIIFMLQGIFTIIAAAVDTHDAGMKLLEIVSGILGIAAGLIILQNPVSGGLMFVWILGIYGIINGTLGIASALSLRQLMGEVESVLSPRRVTAKG